MKKNVLHLFIFLISTSVIAQTNTQSLFYDAIYIKQFIENNAFNFDSKAAKNKSEIELMNKRNTFIKMKVADSIEKINKQLIEIKEAKKDTLATILKKYNLINESKDLIDDKTIIENLSQNVYLAGIEWSGLTREDRPIPKFTLSTMSKSIGGLNVTNFADGLAKFLVERTKQELSITFFQKFKDDLNGSDELKALFPSTLKVLNTIDKEIYMFDAYINVLREACIKDLMNFYENFQKFEKIPKYQLYFERHPELYTLLSTSFYLINQYSKGVHPGKVLADFDTSDVNFSNEALQINLKSSIVVTKLFSESLRSKNTDHYWISQDSLNLLWKDPVLLNIYLGLIYQKGEGIKFKNKSDTVLFQIILKDLKENVKKLEDPIQSYKNFIQTLHADAIEVEEYLNVLNKKSKTEKDYNDYYILYSASLDLFEDAFKFIDLPYVSLSNEAQQIKEQSDKWIYMARSSGELYVDIRTKNYSSAILNVVSILDSVFPNITRALFISLPTSLSKDDVKKIKGYLNLEYKISIDSFLETSGIEGRFINTAKSYIETSLEITLLEKNAELRNSILKYGTFAAAISQAQNSDEVKAAIEAIALPTGSSSIKRNTTFNLSLNAFVGLYAAGEARDAKNKNNHHVNYWRFSSGLTAPVGLAFSWGNHKCKDTRNNGKTVGGKSLGFFIPIIDIGAVTAMRFKDSTASLSPEIKLQNIFAPGFYLHYGFGKCPISLLIGGQIGPSLRNITAQNATIDNQLYTRLGATLTVDIPVLNLYTRTHPDRGKKK